MIRRMIYCESLLLYIISTGITMYLRGRPCQAEIGAQLVFISAYIIITAQKNTAAMRPAITQRRHWLLAIRFTAPAMQLRCWCG